MDFRQRFQPGFERLQAALTGKPDRVPFTAQMHELSMKRSGVPARRFYTEARELVEGILRTAAELDFDVPSLGYDAYDVEAEALGQPLLFPEGQGPIIDKERVLLRERSDLDHLRPPDPRSSARMPFVVETNRLYLDRTGHPSTIQFCAPFSLAVILRGYQSFVEDLYGEPRFAHRLLTFLTEEVLAPWIGAQHRACPQARTAVGADALASPPLASPEMISEFDVPYILRLRELTGLQVAVRNWWGESNLNRPRELLELKLAVSEGVLQGQDPDVYQVGPGLYRQFADQHGCPLVLGVGEELLAHGPPAKIEERIHRYIAAAGAQGRLILYLCNLSAGTPLEHVRAAVGAVHRYGAP